MRLLLPLIFGLVGTAILVSLGVWQVQRLAWKEGVLAEIESRINDAPVAIPARPDPVRDRYLPVKAQGRYTGDELHVLVSTRDRGAGYRIIAGFETDGRRIMVDRGYVPVTEKSTPRAPGPAQLVGNLHWPDEIDGFTPEPDLGAEIWFARDVPEMARSLQTEPVLLIVRQTSEIDAGVSPLPVDTVGIPNDHLQYAVTWFGLAAVWVGMTLFYIRRQLRAAAKEQMT